MKKYLLLHILIAFSSLFFFISCSSDDSSIETIHDDPIAELEAEERFDVSYGPNAKQNYDIYLPAGRSDETTKVLLLIHGGGWTSGDKSDMTEFVSLIQDNYPDYAIVNTNYVLAELAIPAFPNQFLDIQSVVRQITLESEELQIKPEFGFIGASAGAHLALMYDYVYDTDDQVKFVADIVGPADFTDPFYANDPNFAIALSILVDESAYPAGSNLSEAVSPVYQVSASSSPTLLFYGDQDPLVPLSNGESLELALEAAEIENIFTVYEGGHGDNWSLEDRADLEFKLNTYIETYLPL
ncbi:MAG: alpha/beta hydrolase [Flavobacteriaceae bacterium]